MTLADLSKRHKEHVRKTSPNVPEYGLPTKRYSDKTANGLTTAIMDLCKFDGVMAMRTGNEGRYRPGSQVVDVIGRTRSLKGTWLPGHNKGVADVSIIASGKIYWLEIKIGKDRQSSAQKDFEAKARSAGAVYLIISNWKEFITFYKTIKTP